MIYNLTQHQATPEQQAVGVTLNALPEIKQLLNFTTIPSKDELDERAEQIVQMFLDSLTIDERNQKVVKVMIGGAPFFMGYLEKHLKAYEITPLYAFSERVSVEKQMDDGSVVKQNVFKHVGFVEV